MHVDAGRLVGAAGGTHDAGNRVGKDEADSGRDNAYTECRVEREGGDAVDFVGGLALTELAGGEGGGTQTEQARDCHDDAEDGHTVAGGGELFDAAVVADEVGVHHIVDAGDGEAERHRHTEGEERLEDGGVFEQVDVLRVFACAMRTVGTLRAVSCGGCTVVGCGVFRGTVFGCGVFSLLRCHRFLWFWSVLCPVRGE